MNKSKLEVITCSWCKAREVLTQLVLVFLLIGWKSGANLLSQSRSVVNAKPITFRHSNEDRSKAISKTKPGITGLNISGLSLTSVFRAQRQDFVTNKHSSGAKMMSLRRPINISTSWAFKVFTRSRKDCVGALQFRSAHKWLRQLV